MVLCGDADSIRQQRDQREKLLLNCLTCASKVSPLTSFLGNTHTAKDAASDVWVNKIVTCGHSRRSWRNCASE